MAHVDGGPLKTIKRTPQILAFLLFLSYVCIHPQLSNIKKICIIESSGDFFSFFFWDLDPKSGTFLYTLSFPTSRTLDKPPSKGSYTFLLKKFIITRLNLTKEGCILQGRKKNGDEVEYWICTNLEGIEGIKNQMDYQEPKGALWGIPFLLLAFEARGEGVAGYMSCVEPSRNVSSCCPDETDPLVLSIVNSSFLPSKAKLASPFFFIPSS